VIRLGLTGSIASGKSSVLKAFGDLGIPIFSSDEAVHVLYESEAVPLVEQLFPGVTTSGKVDRTELGRRLIGAPEKLRQLEAAIHPLVRARLAKFLADAEASGAALAVADVPLLFETGFDYGFDRIAVTIASDETIRRRALGRAGMSVDKLDAILARQMPQAEKRSRADYVFDTDRPLAETIAEVGRLAATRMRDVI
jgi:dephospho-CoA kinase